MNSTRVNSPCELLPFLIALPAVGSRKQAKDLLRFGAVTVAGKNALRHDTRLNAGDVVTISSRASSRSESVDLHGLKIVHIDDAIVVVDKPAGLLTMGSVREKERTTHRILNEYLKFAANSKSQQAFIVHRLDRETSGLLMFARSETIQTALQKNWSGVIKKYLAIVEGQPTQREGTLRDNLLETSSMMVRRVAHGGDTAITHFRVIAGNARFSLLELTLETGRKHQIRVQLAGMGNRVVGDRRYGAKTDPARRLALHSCELRFRHPVSGDAIVLQSPLPERLKALVESRRVRST
jgi:23S rRNA pseudouridine1911/1915/1917 synthase